MKKMQKWKRCSGEGDMEKKQWINQRYRFKNARKRSRKMKCLAVRACSSKEKVPEQIHVVVQISSVCHGIVG
jgi:hypothetical protein